MFLRCLLLKYFILFFLLFFSTNQVEAIQATVGHNLFYAPSPKGFKPYLELYWQIDPNSLLFKKENNAWQGKIQTDITLRQQGNLVSEDHYILETAPITEGVRLYAQNIIDLRRYSLKNGSYQIEIKLTDLLRTSEHFVYTDSFVVIENLTKPTLSDIQLVDTVFQSTRQDVFQRNGNIQIPLCANFLDENRKQIIYYAELYQPKQDSNWLIVTASVSRHEFEPPLHQIKHSDTVRYAPISLLYGHLSLNTLPSGNYFLNIVVENLEEQTIAKKSLFFQLINAKPATLTMPKETDTGNKKEETQDTYLNLNKTFLAKYTPAQIRAILKMILPIATPNERNNIRTFLKKPDDIYSRYFVYNFWLSRNKIKPEEAWKEYTTKVKEVNRLFGSSMLQGYESERGIIYLKYGAPDDRMVVNNESGALPYEIWQYNSLPKATNALFLFYRPGLVTNDYRLLHSTVPGEMINKNWRLQLYLNGSSSDANSSRAEQFIGNR